MSTDLTVGADAMAVTPAVVLAGVAYAVGAVIPSAVVASRAAETEAAAAVR
jgi:phosphate/sulfate permease